MQGFNYKKSVQALNFLAKVEGVTMNKMKAIKLIWLADRIHLRKYGRTITGDSYYAMEHGPVPSTTKDVLGLNSLSLSRDELTYIDEYIVISDRYNYASQKEPNFKVFSKTDVAALEEAYSIFGKLNEWQLRDLSHRFPEWKKWEEQIKAYGSRYAMDYEDFFKDADVKSSAFEDDKSNLDLVKRLFFRIDNQEMDAKRN